jgi:mono/diheme cytochrome c family protein
MKRFAKASEFVFLTFLLATGWAGLSASSAQAKEPASTVFDAKCAMCHAKDGSGNTPMGKNMKVPDFRSKAVQSKSNADLATIIEKGKGMMPQYGSQFSKEEINDMVAYIRKLGAKK